MKKIWITWENQRRNEFISKELNAKLYVFDFNDNRIRRYIKCIWFTFKAFRYEKPDIVFCQNPSVVLALFSLLYTKIWGGKLCIDTHNGGMALESESFLLKFIARFLQRFSDLIIVTNAPLKTIVEKNGGRAVVLPDNIPDIKNRDFKPYEFLHSKNLLFICTYARDEPYEEVFKAAKIIESEGRDIGIYVTGKVPSFLNVKAYSDNLHLLGFVSWEDFDRLLLFCDGVIDLTTRENCLVCGAYEAVAVDKPLLISNKLALRSYFNKGACYTDNTAESIARLSIELVDNNLSLSKDVRELKFELKNNWKKNKQELIDALNL